jgi:hypothetical protein
MQKYCDGSFDAFMHVGDHHAARTAPHEGWRSSRHPRDSTTRQLPNARPILVDRHDKKY